METEGTLPENITNNDILEVINISTEPLGLRFIVVVRYNSGNLKLETNLLTSADKGSELIREITDGLRSLEITATNFYPLTR